MSPFQVEEFRDPGPRLRQLAAQRLPERDAHGMEVYQSAYGWIGVQVLPTGMSRLSYFQRCPCSR